MNQDTPLREVVSFIPKDCAEILMYMPEQAQMWVTIALRDVMTQWETTGVSFDPITLENVLRPVVVSLMSAGHAMVEAANKEY